jgi:hypothetical protein
VKIVFLTGRSCVGKSTFVDSIAGAKDCVVRTSVLAEEQMSFSEMANSSDPTAPPQVEDAVVSGIEKAICESQNTHETVYVDASPRNVSQVKWIESLCVKYPQHTIEIWYCLCDDSVRQERVRKGLKRLGKKDLTQARLLSEDTNCVNVLECLFRSTVTVKLLDLSTTVVQERTIDPKTDLSHMFKMHADFNDLVMRRFGCSTASLMGGGAGQNMEPFSNSAVWASRFLKAARNEIDEALQEIPEEWWTVDLVNNDHIREEIIDVWHFLMSAAFAVGMNAEVFASEYYRKRSINIGRQSSGKYSKKKKND